MLFKGVYDGWKGNLGSRGKAVKEKNMETAYFNDSTCLQR